MNLLLNPALPSRGEILPLLPGLRRFAMAMACSDGLCGQRDADDLVVRAVHVILREPALPHGQSLPVALYATLIRLQQGRPGILVRSGAGPEAGFHAGASLNGLPFGHRAALLLVTLEGLSYEAAAAVLGLSRNVLLGRVMAARQLLARQITTTQRVPPNPRKAGHLRLVK